MNWIIKIWNSFKAAFGFFDELLFAYNISFEYVDSKLVIGIDAHKFQIAINNKEAEEIIDKVMELAGLLRTSNFDPKKLNVTITGDKIFEVVKYLVKNNLLHSRVKE